MWFYFIFFKDMLFLHLQHIKNIGTEIMDTPFYEKKIINLGTEEIKL